MTDLATLLPKAELHIHIEGSLEPEMMFALAERNGYDLPYSGVDEIRSAYSFTDLQSFLDIYYQGAAVLQTQQDFYDLMSSYLLRAVADGVRRAEIFFDPQTHTERGIGFEVFMPGFREAIADAERRQRISADLILCVVRHLSVEKAVETLRQAEPHLEKVIGLGLDSTEVGFPPGLWVKPYQIARELGLRTVVHAGEEGPPEYVWGALDLLGAERIDHGVRSMEDPALVERLAREQTPLTVCPLSNVSLKVVDALGHHPLPAMLDAGLNVSINSDDPAYFGGYIGENYRRVYAELNLEPSTMVDLARNSINASFLGAEEKRHLVGELEEAAAS